VNIISHDSERPNIPRPGVASEQLRSTALLFVALIAGMAAIGLVLLANSDQPVGPSEISDCASITAQAERLACFDELARQPALQPFKGATAPALHPVR